MRAALFVVAAAVLAAAAFGFGLKQRSASSGSEGPSAASDAELSALRAETERLRQAVEELQKREAATPGTRGTNPLPQGPQNGAPQQQVPGVAVAAEKTPEQEREEMLSYARYLDDVLARSSQREDLLAAELKAKATGLMDERSTLLNVECGEQLCRITTRHGDSEAYRAFQQKAFMGAAIKPTERLWPGPVSFAVLERSEAQGQPVVAATYMGRGEALPSPDPAR